MKIGRQREDRLRLWAEQFPKHYARPAMALETAYFTTMEHLPYEEAVRREFAPAPAGMKWGAKWEYGWFRTELTVPASLEGERLVVYLRAGQEMLVWVNGRERCSIDWKHPYIPLTRCAKAGERYTIVAEVYAGHGPRMEGAGPVAPGETPVPEPAAKQVTVGKSTLCVWNETVFQAAMDYLTLYSLVKKLPEKSLRAMKIIAGLKQFTYIADFELPREQMTASVAEAAKVLRPLLACRNGSTAPEFTIFGQSHLDMAWLWPVAETMRKTARTYTNQLWLMEEYPAYKFLLCEPPIAEYLRTLYPAVHARVMAKVQEGAIMPEGAMWIESDTNIPSGESLIRQFVWGKRWFRAHGADAQMAWMPDTFGFSAALPQIMRGCGVPYFATQKTTRQDPEAEPFPHNLFWWEGLDGSRVLSHIFKKNNANFDAGDLITRWEDDRVQQEGMDGLMYPFGFGDGGGGPTREMVEIARRCADLEGAPRCRMESPVAYFRRQTEVERVHTGEIYLAWHRGTYTAQTRTKRLIRQAETALRQAEYMLARRMLAGGGMPANWRETLDRCWETLLFNQFHDIAAGASIHRVHERAECELQQVICDARSLLTTLLGEGEYIHNALPWARDGVPAQGCALPEATGDRAFVTPDGDGYILRNARLTCRVNAAGEVTGVTMGGREYLQGAGNRFLMYKDVNTCYDAWEIGSMYDQLPVAIDSPVTLTAGSDDAGAYVDVSRRIHDSLLTQRILLGHGAARVDFITTVDWHERHKLLKVAFPVNVRATEMVNEIQFGHLRRPTHRSYQTDRDRYEVAQQRWSAMTDGAHGAAVLNDGKYGISGEGSEMRLTLLRAPLMPDMTADQGLQQFTYAFLPFEGDMTATLREAAALNEPLLRGAPADGEPILLPDADNIVVETVKPADDGTGLIVRAYEAMGRHTTCRLRVHSGVNVIAETDMLEQSPRAVDPARVEFRAFEIKTFLLYL